MDKESLKEFYSKLSQNYDELAINKAKYNSHIWAYKKILQTIKLTKKTKVLDLGCGTGLSSKKYLEKECEVWGVDITFEMLEKARKYNYNKLIQNDIEKELSLPKKYFDIILILSVSEFIQEPKKLLKKVKEFMKKEGIIAITFPAKLPKNSRIKHKNYTKEETDNIIKHSKLKIICYEYEHGYNKLDGPEKVNYHNYILKN